MNKPQGPMRILESAHNAIIDYIASRPAETGGALFGYEHDHLVRRFIPDTNAVSTRTTYTINTDYINPVIKQLWAEEGLSLIGIIHSHPPGTSMLSAPDLRYFGQLLGKVKRERFYAPVVHTVPDGGYRMFPYELDSEGNVLGRTSIELVPDEPVEMAPPAIAPDMHEYPAPLKRPSLAKAPQWSRIFTSPIAIERAVEWQFQALRMLFIMLAAWSAVSITPYFIRTLQHILTP